MRDDLIKTAKEFLLKGPVLPEEVTREEYDKVMKYLNTTGFLGEVLKGVRQVQVGEYIISSPIFDVDNPKKVYVEVVDGEGGEFATDKLEPFITEFFLKHF